MTSPRITLIVPTCSRPQALHRCLMFLQPQLSGHADIELLVTDDSPGQETKEMLKRDFPNAVWLQGPRQGPAANRNHAAAHAHGEWLIFVDDDCEPRAEFLQAYLTQFSASHPPEAVLYQGAIHSKIPEASLLWEAPYKVAGGDMLVSCNFAIPRQTFLENGGFDTRYPVASFEDTELADRLLRSGIPIHFVADSIVDHPLRPLPSSKRLAQRWECRVISSYDYGASPLQILVRLPRHVLALVLCRFRGREMNEDNRKAAAIFFVELIRTFLCIPWWVIKHRNTHSTFWSDQVRRGVAPEDFGL